MDQSKLNTKYVAVLGYMVDGDINGQMSKKVISEIIENLDIN